MKRDLYISIELLNKKGHEYFKGETADDYSYYTIYGRYEDMIVTQDDMGNIELSLTEDDACFINAEEL